MNIKSIIITGKIKTREKCNFLFAPIRRKRLRNMNFTIISNNCWAGHVYRYFGLPYNTPTIGLYFFADDYLKFIKELKHYIESELYFISLSQSKHMHELLEHGGLSTICPIGVIDDIEIIFLHYKSEREAYEKWNRRKKRIVWNNLYVKMSQMNNCSLKNMIDFENIPIRKKFIFVKEDYGLPSQIIYKGFKYIDEIKNDTNNFRHYINLTNWLNGKSYKKNQ